MEIRDATGKVLGKLASIPSQFSETRDIPWLNLAETFVPLPGDQVANQLAKFCDDNPIFQKSRPFSIGGQLGKICAVSYPMEIGWQKKGTGWLFFVIYPERRPGQGGRAQILKCFRAGPRDLGLRSPVISKFLGKRAALFGAGAIGAPIALDLARNGISRLDIVEYDQVEPGNSVRWPLGMSAWGFKKGTAIEEFVREHYPSTKVTPHDQYVGIAQNDEPLFHSIREADFIIDATASPAVSRWLGDRCRAAGLPFFSVWATPMLKSGTVTVHIPSGGCPECLEWAWEQRKIAEPLGYGAELTEQPPGCSERTFIGANFDLQELSLQMMRVLATYDKRRSTSTVHTLEFHSDAHGTLLPVWRSDDFPSSPKCTTCQTKK